MANIPNLILDEFKNLDGTDARLIGGIAYFCPFWTPWTDEPLQSFYKYIGMDKSQASKVYKKLEAKKIIAQRNGRTYFIKIDSWVLDDIETRHPNELRILGSLGCIEAQERVDKLTAKTAEESALNQLLPLFFLYSSLSLCPPELSGSPPPVESMTTSVDIDSTPYKDSYGLENTIVNGRGEEASSAANEKLQGSRDEAGAGRRPGELSKEFDEDLREDIKNDAKWRKWLATKSEFKSINIEDLWDAMLKWCRKKRAIASRRRFLGWIHLELNSIPVDTTITEEKSNGNGNGNSGNQTVSANDANDAHLQPRGIPG